MDVKDATTSAYGSSKQREVQKTREACGNDVHPLHISNEKKGVDENMSSSTDTMEIARELDRTSALNI